MKGKNPEVKNPTNPEAEAATTENSAIKCNYTGNMEVNEKEMEPHKTTDWDTAKQPHYADNKYNDEITGGKFAPIYQKTQAEEASSQ